MEFPVAFCSDATAVLGVIYMMALVGREQIIEVTANPNKPNPQYNFHRWLCVEGTGIDLTAGQFRPQEKRYKGAAIFSTHPFEEDADYTIERKQFIKPEKSVVLFAEHIAIKYVFPPDAVEMENS